MAEEPPILHHPAVRDVLRDVYRPADVARVADLLRSLGVLDLHPLDNGLYPAAGRVPDLDVDTGYQQTWVRDSVHVANAAWEAGQLGSVRRTATTLCRWFAGQGPRLQAHIAGDADPQDKRSWPHVRFDGRRLAELPEPWPHHQNDALGYGLWFLARAALSGLLVVDEEAHDVLARFPRFFSATAYWDAADHGHWEETAKLQSSSVGAVVAGLRALRGLARKLQRGDDRVASAVTGGMDLDDLIARGERMLADTLPAESRDDTPGPGRRADAALLFLIEPLRVVDDATADAILASVDELVGPYGIRRYTGDSYWMADYKQRFDEETRTGCFEDDLATRDALLAPGTEAQWCLFDPLLSTIHGWRFLKTRDDRHRELQRHHLHRSLGQLTGPDCPLGAGLCPEAYYLPDSRQPDAWTPNDDTPLLWTQAHLVQALCALERTAGLEAS